jgi:hypothetical protein
VAPEESIETPEKGELGNAVPGNEVQEEGYAGVLELV